MKYTLKDFLPLIIIFTLIVGFTATMQIFYGEGGFEFGMRMFMASFFAIFGSFKLLNLRNFAIAYRKYDLLAMRSQFYSFLYPFLEIALAILYFLDFGGLYRDVFTFILMTFSAVGVYLKVRKKEEIQCACLGTVFSLPMTWVTLVEDMLMAVEALIMIVLHPIILGFISSYFFSLLLGSLLVPAFGIGLIVSLITLLIVFYIFHKRKSRWKLLPVLVFVLSAIFYGIMLVDQLRYSYYEEYVVSKDTYVTSSDLKFSASAYTKTSSKTRFRGGTFTKKGPYSLMLEFSSDKRRKVFIKSVSVVGSEHGDYLRDDFSEVISLVSYKRGNLKTGRYKFEDLTFDFDFAEDEEVTVTAVVELVDDNLSETLELEAVLVPQLYQDAYLPSPFM